MEKEAANPYRLLPSVEEVLTRPDVRSLGAALERALLAAFVAEILARWRAEIGAGELDSAGVRERLERGDIARVLDARVRGELAAGLVPVVNATVVVLHTGLGRASVHPEAAALLLTAMPASAPERRASSPPMRASRWLRSPLARSTSSVQ